MNHISDGRRASAISRKIFIIRGLVIILLIYLSIRFPKIWQPENGEEGLNLLPLLITIVVSGILWIFQYNYQKTADREKNIEDKRYQTEIDAIFYSTKVNELLQKSLAISNKILPYYESTAIKLVENAKIDLTENAISPFWEKIEDTSKSLALYKQAIDQLITNGDIYINILKDKKHNFPIPFPLQIDISSSIALSNEYNSVIRKAQKITSFATIWEIRRNTTVNISGFRTLEQAINNMSSSIIESIADLNDAINTGFREVQNIQHEHLKSLKYSQQELEDTLKGMDRKLYFIQYQKKPNSPFQRPFLDI